jgi:hypothetical protein
MTTTIRRLFYLAVLAANGSNVCTAHAEDKPILKWEYRLLTKDQLVELGKNDLGAGLNKLGNEGWELTVVDGAYIFKRPKPRNDREIADLKLRISVLRSDIEMQKERVAWANRMGKMGYMSMVQVAAEQDRLGRMELVLEKTKKELEGLVGPPAEPIPVAPLPRESKPEK